MTYSRVPGSCLTCSKSDSKAAISSSPLPSFTVTLASDETFGTCGPPPRGQSRDRKLARMTVHERPFGRYFEDFEPGDVYKHWPGKTITEYDDHLFCMITMNHHPLHTDAWFAE